MKYILITLQVLLCLTIHAQKRKTTLKIPKAPINIKLSFFGRSNRPGIKTGMEYMIINKVVTINKNNGKKIIRKKESFLTTNLSYYEHAAFDRNAMFTIDVLRRKTFTNGIFLQAAIGVGFSKMLEKYQPVYLRKTDGSLEKINIKRNLFIVPAAVGIGYDFSKKTNKPFKLFFNMGINSTIYGNWPYFDPRADIGIITSIKALKFR